MTPLMDADTDLLPDSGPSEDSDYLANAYHVTLAKGLKQFYMNRSTAPYWDGRNNMGDQVASGVYFYSLQTPDFSVTRKMLILE